MRTKLQSWTTVWAALLLQPAIGCVSAQAGWRETRDIVHARLGASLPADDADAERGVSDLLAKPLTAESTTQIALLRNMEVRAAFDRIGIARGDLVAALRLPNPSAEAALRFRGKSTDPDIDIGGSVDVRELILIPLRQKAAADDLDEASVQAASAIMDVALRARMAYVDYVAAQQQLELERSVLLAVSASAELASQLRAAGNTSELDALMERSLYEQARLDYAGAEAEAIGARERLNLAMGVSASEGGAWSAMERLGDPPDDEIALGDLEEKSVSASLDLGALRARYAAASGRVNLATAEGAIPSVRLGAMAERDPEGWGVGPQIGIGIPIFYQGEGAAASARSEMKTTQDQAIGAAAQIRSMARNLGLELVTARARVLHYKTVILPLDAQIVDAAQLQYNAMSISAFQLFQARREQIHAAKSYVASVASYWRVKGEVEMLLAGHLPAATPPAPQLPLESGRALGAPPD